MHPTSRSALVVLCTLMLGCAAATIGPATTGGDHAADATLAQPYFWRARPGMIEEYSRYIREVAEPIDREAQRVGAFVTVATYAANDTLLPWTHMRVFMLRDSSQLRALGAELSAAGTRLEPDSSRRQRRAEYSATLRDRVGSTVTQIVR